jgi:hypothetical protein
VGSIITTENIAAFTRGVKEFLHGNNHPYQASLYAIIARSEVTDTTIRIVGDAGHLGSLAAEESDPENFEKARRVCAMYADGGEEGSNPVVQAFQSEDPHPRP